MNFDKPLYITGSSLASAIDSRPKAMTFRVGAILDVLVTRQQDASSYTLKLGQQQLNASSERPLTVGQRALLQVVGSDAQGRPALRPLTERQSQVALQLQQRVMSQPPAPPLRQLVQAQVSSPVVRQTIGPLRALLPQREDVLQPDRLRQTLQRSGIFLEAMLLRGVKPASSDLKSALLQILAQRQPPLSPNQLAPPPAPAKPPPDPPAPQREARPSPVPQQRPADSLPASQRPTYEASAKPPAQTASGTVSQQPQTATPPSPPKTALEPAIRQPLPQNLSQAGARAPAADKAPTPPPAQFTKGAQVSHAYQQAAPTQAPQKGLQLGQFLAGIEAKLETLPQLVRTLEASVSRIESQQLASLQAREQGQAQWLLDLPVRSGDNVDYWQLFMRREQRSRPGTEQREQRWLVTLQVELGAAGALAIHIDHGQQQTWIKLFSENPEVLQWVAHKSPLLQAKLSRAGIENSEVEGHFGPLPEALQPKLDLPGVSATA